MFHNKLITQLHVLANGHVSSFKFKFVVPTGFDLVLLEFAEVVNHPCISPVCLPKVNTSPVSLGFGRCLVAGWGDITGVFIVASQVTFLDVRFPEERSGRPVIPHMNKIIENTFCLFIIVDYR